MAITDNQTAFDVATLLHWLLPHTCRNSEPETPAGAPAEAPVPLPALLSVLDAAERLAERAHKQVMCGPTAAAVRQAAAIDLPRLMALGPRRQ